MCASYGLDPRFDEHDLIDVADAGVLQSLRAFAATNANEPLRPTGRHLRNLNPVFTADQSSHIELTSAWWGYLVEGRPSKFPSINTRSERLGSRPGRLPGRAIVPATSWFELQKPDRVWYDFEVEHRADAPPPLFGMAAVTQRGVTESGEPVICYSIVMRPAVPWLRHIHDRMPVLIPGTFATEWLTSDDPAPALIDAALAASEARSESISATRRAG
ncbi:MAG TPA: SOS response-associated peptidase family protein [Candidatus Lumbricidophila sp.]|nr:SOS response-associated peptidase family protein [Candidatus Lumbricidophila sp.]